MSLLVSPETVLQGLVHNALHAGVGRRVHLNPPLQQIFHAEIGVEGLELLEDVLDDGRRRERLSFVVADRFERAPLGVRRRLRRQESVRLHQGQRLVSPTHDGARVPGARGVVTRRFRNAGEQRGLVGIVGSEGRELPAEIVLGRSREPVLAVAHVHKARVSSEDLFFRTALRPEPMPHGLFEPQREPHLLTLSSQHIDASRADRRRQQAGHDPGVPKLVAVLLCHHAAEKGPAHELLRDRRPALREERRAGDLVVTAAPQQPTRQHAGPDLPEHARHADVVDPVV